MSDKQRLVDEKLARLRAAIDLEPHDKVPIVATADFWPVRLSKTVTMQEAYYSFERTAECYKAAFTEFGRWDAFSSQLQCLGPALDASGSRRYKIPGRDLSPSAEFQHPDLTLMHPDEYGKLIDDPLRFLLEGVIPRLCTRIGSDNPYIRMSALAKATLYFAQLGQKARSFTKLLAEDYGIPPLFQGQSIYVPVDFLADKIRGFHQGLLDIKERPEDVQAACEALVPFLARASLSAAHVSGGFPLIFNPQHVSPYISPRDYQRVYWPTFKKIVDEIVQRGHKVWVFFEGNQEHHLECLQELPRGKVVAHFEATDLCRAKKALGGRICIAGGMPSLLLTRGTPEQISAQAASVIKLFEDEPGFIMTSSTTLPSTTRPENLHAWLNAVEEYGRMSGTTPLLAPRETPHVGGEVSSDSASPTVAWEEVRAELGRISGDESIVREKWEELEGLLLPLVLWLVR